MTDKPAVLLFSGGIDSTVVLALLTQNKRKIHTISISYGFPGERELEGAKKLCDHYEVEHDSWVDLSKSYEQLNPPTEFYAPRREGIWRPTLTPEEKSYLPARNLVFIGLAVAYAQTIGSHEVWTGDIGYDPFNMPSCTREFYDKLEPAIREGSTIPYRDDFQLFTPLSFKEKDEIIRMGLAMQVPFEYTHTCWKAGIPCGKCEGCKERMGAFKKLGINDPELEALGLLKPIMKKESK